MTTPIEWAPAGAAPRAPAYEYLSDWRLDAAPEAVWQAITAVEDWPRWWPHVRRVRTLREGRRGGDDEGLGALRRIDWSSRLPYGFSLEVEVVEVRRLHRLVGRASGDLEGLGTWELWPEGRGTRVSYRWQLALNTRWMRLAAPVMAPLFRWNHEGVMRAGGAGLAGWLGTCPRA